MIFEWKNEFGCSENMALSVESVLKVFYMNCKVTVRPISKRTNNDAIINIFIDF